MAFSIRTIRVCIADGRPIILAGMCAVLHVEGSGMHVIGEAANATELLRMLGSRADCQVVVTDFSMSAADGCDGDGLRMLWQIRARHPGMSIVVFTDLRNPPLLQAVLELGVRALVDKAGSLTELPAAIHCAASGRRYVSRSVQPLLESAPRLSRHEAEVIRLFANGKTVSEIAQSFSRSVKTVSRQKSDAMRKLGIDNHSQLYAYALSAGLAR